MLDTIPVPKNATRYFVYLAGFIFFFWYTLLPVLGFDLSRSPGDLVDPRFNLYLLEHSYKYISGQESTFWTAGFFYPHQNVVAYSDNFLGSFMFYVPFRMIGFDRETAFQFWIITGFALNFAAMAFVLDRSGFGRLAVTLGSAVFAFSPLQFNHLEHIQVLYRMPVPVAWYFLDRFLDEYRSPFLALALAFLAWQFYMSVYLGYFLCFLMLFYLAAVVVERKKSVIAHYFAATLSRSRLWHLGMALAFCLGLAPLFAHYFAPGVTGTPMSSMLDILPRPVSYVIGSRYDLVEKALGGQIDVESYVPWEHKLFVGLIPWVALLFGTVLAIRGGDSTAPKLRRVSFMFWGCFLLTLSFHGASLYRLLVWCLPMLTGIRAVSRISLVLLLPFAYMTAAGLERLSREAHRLLPGSLAGLPALVICLMFAWETNVGAITINKVDAQRRIATLEKNLGLEKPRPKVSGDGPVLAVLSQDKPQDNFDLVFITQLDAMLAAQDLNIVTLNGYSRVAAPRFRYLTGCGKLAELLHDYSRAFPSFSTKDVANRIKVFDARTFKPAGPLPDDAYTAKIAPACMSCPSSPGSLLKVLVNVTNLSLHPWPQDGLALSARFVRIKDGVALSGFDNRVPLGADFSPRQSRPLLLEMNAPPLAGQYRLEIDLVHEAAIWFSDKHTKRGELLVAVSDHDEAGSADCPPSSPASPPAAAVRAYALGAPSTSSPIRPAEHKTQDHP